MLGIEMMMKSLGVQPEEIRRQAEEVVQGVKSVQDEIARQGRLLDALARHAGIDPRAYDAENPKEIDYEQH